MLSHVTDKLKRFKISKKAIQNILEQHDLDYLLANIKIVEENASRGRVKNPSAYLMKAIQNDYRPTKLVQPINENPIAQKSKEESIFFENKKRLEQQIASLPMKTQMDCKKNFKVYLNNNPFFKKILETKGIQNEIIQHQWLRFM